MGYFSSTIVFTSQPVWETLLDLPAKIGLRGYRHNGAPLWFLDFWTGPKPPSSPFTQGREAKIFSTFDTDLTVDRLQQIGNFLDEPYGWNWLRFALQVSRLTDCDVYFLAADDDLYDLGATIALGTVKRLALRVGLCNITAQDGNLTITPGTDAEDELDDAPSGKLPDELRDLPFVAVNAPVAITGGLPFYGNVVAEWPSEAGDPELLLGLGTWDPFLDIDKRSTVEFERLVEPKIEEPPVETTTKKPWWRFW